MVPASLLTPFSFLSSWQQTANKSPYLPWPLPISRPPLQLGDLKLIGLNRSPAALSLPTLLSLESNLLNESSVFSLALPYPSSSHSTQSNLVLWLFQFCTSTFAHVCPSTSLALLVSALPHLASPPSAHLLESVFTTQSSLPGCCSRCSSTEFT